VDRSYLYHCLQHRGFRDAITGAAQPQITRQNLTRVQIPLPLLDEQRRIAAILDKANALRRKRQRAIDLLYSLTQSIFLEMLGYRPDRWSSLTLREAVEEFRYGTSIKSGPSGFPVLRIPNVIGGEIDLSGLKTVSLDRKEFQRLQMREGDLLLVRTNGNPDYVGRCAVFDSSLEDKSEFPSTDFVYASYLIRARLRPNTLNPYYVQTFLSSEFGRKAMSERSKTSAGQFNVNTDGLGSIEVPAPPLALQDAFADRRKAVQSAIALHRRAAERANNLFSSLQHRAFSGQL
jgi:type I restriction enzyme S subunit